jgi:hypothetical protein
MLFLFFEAKRNEVLYDYVHSRRNENNNFPIFFGQRFAKNKWMVTKKKHYATTTGDATLPPKDTSESSMKIRMNIKKVQKTKK